MNSKGSLETQQTDFQFQVSEKGLYKRTGGETVENLGEVLVEVETTGSDYEVKSSPSDFVDANETGFTDGLWDVRLRGGTSQLRTMRYVQNFSRPM